MYSGFIDNEKMAKQKIIGSSVIRRIQNAKGNILNNIGYIVFVNNPINKSLIIRKGVLLLVIRYTEGITDDESKLYELLRKEYEGGTQNKKGVEKGLEKGVAH